ncbi:MAG: hypothetical protein AUJ12_06065 [Alphaproteobacteria bacterium CG1_02_46_17]|nr:MAG: hypothetical protein AUJ12_06065 [Alphaproteobacteria bacterium CG1_02_46_17]
MTALRDIQAAFMHDIYTGERTSAGFLDPAIGSSARLDIYYNNTLFGLTDVLANTYSVLQKIVGEDFFKTIARHYLKAHPQPAGNRHLFGGQLSIFLGNFESAATLPYLPDIAALEWAHFQAGIANDAVAMDFATLTTAMSSDTSFVLPLHPSVHVCPQTFNALEIWQEHQKKDIGAVQLISQPHTLLIWRAPDNTVLMRCISLPFIRLLQSCQKNTPFVEAVTLAGDELYNAQGFQREFAEAVSLGVFAHGQG